ncbi:MAG: metallophosphoesterase [Saprospiraceae bacterium]|nr:metallophosphoesterase [Saprospiraceae bacterium]
MSETKTILLHLTDLHFGDNHSRSHTIFNFSADDISHLVIEKVKHDFTCKNLVIVLGGDITDKGAAHKYQYALDFVRKLRSGFKGYKIEFMICPGNHDIDIKNPNNSFDAFNKFSTDVTGNSKYIYTDSKTSVIHTFNNWSFLSANSMYHKIKDYGILDMSTIEANLKKAKHPVVVLTHHHLVPIYKKDSSVCRNSYDLFKLSLNYGVKLILHGHVHTSFKLDIANAKGKIKIIGSGALLPKIDTNYNNQFSIIGLNDHRVSKVITYRIIFDDANSYRPTAIKS